MTRVMPITEQFQHFVRDLKESFWGDLYGKTKLAWKQFLEGVSQEARDRYVSVEEEAGKQEYRNGFYERSLVTIFGTLVLRIARTRRQSFLPRAIERFQRRAEEVMLLIREAFLRGVSTRQVGRVVAIVTGELRLPSSPRVGASGRGGPLQHSQKRSRHQPPALRLHAAQCPGGGDDLRPAREQYPCGGFRPAARASLQAGPGFEFGAGPSCRSVFWLCLRGDARARRPHHPFAR